MSELPSEVVRSKIQPIIDVDRRSNSHGYDDIHKVLPSLRFSEPFLRQRHGSNTVFQHYGKIEFILHTAFQRKINPARDFWPKEYCSGIAINDSRHRNT